MAQDKGTGLIEGLVALTGDLDKRRERDSNQVSLILFKIQEALNTPRAGIEVRAELLCYGCTVVVFCNGFRDLRIYKRNDWYWTHDCFLLNLGPNDYAKTINKMLDFIYRPFDPENDMDVDLNDLPRQFDADAWRAAMKI